MHLGALERAFLLKLSMLSPSRLSCLQLRPRETLKSVFGKQSHQEAEYHVKFPARMENLGQDAGLPLRPGGLPHGWGLFALARGSDDPSCWPSPGNKL